MTPSRATRSPLVRCDCCCTLLPDYPSEIYLGEWYVMPMCSGVGIYCEPCYLAIDKWTGGRGLPHRGLPQRCPNHLNPGRLAEIDERNARWIEAKRVVAPARLVELTVPTEENDDA